MKFVDVSAGMSEKNDENPEVLEVSDGEGDQAADDSSPCGSPQYEEAEIHK